MKKNLFPFVLDEIKEYNFGEIIIVDGHSTDNTKLVAQNYGATFIQQDKKGWGSAVLQRNFSFIIGIHYIYGW